MALVVFLIICSYLLGSLPTAVIISRTFYGFDLREKGSGNMGSTNAFRVLGWKAGVIVQVIDILKGVAPVLVFATYASEMPYNHYNLSLTELKIIAGISAVAGHIWSLFVNFKGGKGINTATGMLLSILPYEVLIAILGFVIAVAFTGFISLGSLIAAIVLPLALIFHNQMVSIESFNQLLILSLTMTVVVFYTHRKNIVRLKNGTENKFNKLQIIKRKKNNGK